MDNAEDFTLDIKTYTLVHEATGFSIHAEDVMMNEDQWVIDTIREGCGVELDDFFIEVLRDTIEGINDNPYGD